MSIELKDTKVDKYVEVIKKSNPNISIDKYSFNDEGQNNDIVVINDDSVFKFPKYVEGIEKLKIETSILKKLGKFITLEIPNPEFVNFDSMEVGKVFSGYKIIKGSSFKKDIFNSVRDKDIIAEELAMFLKELHSVSLGEFSDYNIKSQGKDEWRNLFCRIQEKLFPYMKKESRFLVSRDFNYFLEKNSDFNLTLIHGDFGPSNIIFNHEDEKIRGVIDFSEISIGDPANDIAALIGPFGYGEDFVKLFDPIYPNVEELLERAKFYASTFPLQEALFGIESNDKDAFNAGIRDYL